MTRVDETGASSTINFDVKSGPSVSGQHASRYAMISPDLLDPAALDRVLAPFGASRMPPRAAYTSTDVFEWERANFFAGTWTCLGRRPARGQQAYAVGGTSVLVTAAAEGVRAFANEIGRAHV